ncbi:hypothetical protein BHE74_00003187, partial [Ensete ventricosum]
RYFSGVRFGGLWTSKWRAFEPLRFVGFLILDIRRILNGDRRSRYARPDQNLELCWSISTHVTEQIFLESHQRCYFFP